MSIRRLRAYEDALRPFQRIADLILIVLIHKVKLGITGWAQANGWRGETATVDCMEKRIQHDLEYIDNWSFLWDLKIVPRAIFGPGGSGRAY